MKSWWTAMSRIEKNLKKEKLIEEAKVVSEVNKKAVEPAYNFYKIEGEKVADHAGMLSGLLVFYVAYTMWWGYSIFYLFDGLGLSMKKAKVRKEA
jgi:capsid portal protein